MIFFILLVLHNQARGRKLYPDRKSRDQPIRERFPQHRPNVPAATRISLDDVVNMAEHAREATSLQSRRLVIEEAQRALRYENAMMERSRPHSVIGPGLQAFTSPMPSPSRGGQVDHIPSLLPLPSDRTFIPSPDHNHDRHVTTTPTDHFRLEDEHRRQRVEISQILLHRCQQEGDETVYVEPGGDHRARTNFLNTSSLEMKLGYT
ncbi:hypothetical protein PoB_001428500 [Plakobranchus ocellatus]|uniref:Uncharacterized protein n=1 Tax=Plakobranchus ocellatus TaxID=259542 RepID=A0AAV3YY12_9GAST|nr:hypothetical protein PoB_001428500 [Plakobranchus ocellatus]